MIIDTDYNYHNIPRGLEIWSDDLFENGSDGEISFSTKITHSFSTIAKLYSYKFVKQPCILSTYKNNKILFETFGPLFDVQLDSSLDTVRHFLDN